MLKYLQVIQSPSDADYLDQLIPSLKEASYSNKTSQLLGALSDFASGREAEIERQCNTNHQEFVNSVNQLLRIREGTVNLTNEILDLNQSIQSSTEKLVDQKKALVDSRASDRTLTRLIMLCRTVSKSFGWQTRCKSSWTRRSTTRLFEPWMSYRVFTCVMLVNTS